MVMNAIGEPDTFQVTLQSIEILTFAMSIQTNKYSLHQFSDTEVVFAHLVESDVSSPKRGFCEVKSHHSLSWCQILKSIESVSEDLNVSKSLVREAKIVKHLELHF